MKTRDGHRFVVLDRETGKSSGWLSVGSTFQGYKVVDFDDENEVLAVGNSGSVVRLSLKEARVKDGKAGAGDDKMEFKLALTPAGEPILNGQALTFEQLELTFRQFAQRGAPVAIVIQEPEKPNQVSFEAVRKIAILLRESGMRKWSIRIAHTQPK